MGAEAVTKFSAGMVRKDGVLAPHEVTAMLRLKKLWAEAHRVNRKLPVHTRIQAGFGDPVASIRFALHVPMS